MGDKIYNINRSGRTACANKEIDEALTDVADQLVEVRDIVSDLRNAVIIAREKGATWAEIGALMGVSQEAAFRRFTRPSIGWMGK